MLFAGIRTLDEVGSACSDWKWLKVIRVLTILEVISSAGSD